MVSKPFKDTLYCILLYCVILNCIVLLIYCYVDIIQYNAMHNFVGVLDNPDKQATLQFTCLNSCLMTNHVFEVTCTRVSMC